MIILKNLIHVIPVLLTASNLGAVGEGVFAQKEGTDLQFKKIVGGTGTTVTATGNTITIDGSGIGTLTIGTDNGSIVVNTSTTISVNGGNGIATRQTQSNYSRYRSRRFILILTQL